MVPALTLITATCDQPTGFALCEAWMRRQTVPLTSVQWIVVDDGLEPATPTCGQEYVRRERGPATGAESFCRNVLAGLERARGERVFIVEHDDFYKPDHLERTLELLDRPGVVIAGDDRQRYYHVAKRRWHVYHNRGAAFCQTAFHRELIPLVQETAQRCLEAGVYGVDTALWAAVEDRRKALRPIETVVGIKGIPGPRKGLGIGHRDEVIKRWKADPNLRRLRAWVGSDWEVYARMGGPVPAVAA